jgi:hypothetical protein
MLKRLSLFRADIRGVSRDLLSMTFNRNYYKNDTEWKFSRTTFGSTGYKMCYSKLRQANDKPSTEYYSANYTRGWALWC